MRLNQPKSIEGVIRQKKLKSQHFFMQSHLISSSKPPLKSQNFFMCTRAHKQYKMSVQ